VNWWRVAWVVAVFEIVAALAVVTALSLAGCSERAENALAYGGASIMRAFALLLIVVCLSGFEIRKGPPR